MTEPRKKLTVAERQAVRRERMRALGFKQVLLWVHPDDQERLTRYVSRLNTKRGLKK